MPAILFTERSEASPTSVNDFEGDSSLKHRKTKNGIKEQKIIFP